jgi:tripartite-type tricarboxylate transporter receptor subunit TctC
VNTLREALELAWSKPGQLIPGSPGNGTSGHLIGESLNNTAGVTMQHVPYRGAAPLLTDLLAGRLDIVNDNLPTHPQLAREGKVKLLAVTSAERWFPRPRCPPWPRPPGCPASPP